MKSLLLLLVLLFLAACAGKITPIPDSSSSEAVIYIEKCGGCHSIPHPKRHTYFQWDNVMTIMDKNIKYKGLPSLTIKEREQIMSYLKKHARKIF